MSTTKTVVYPTGISDFLTGDPIEHEVTYSLDEWKARKNACIDRRTEQLITQGFVYDGNLFSTSIVAQINWTNVDHAQDELTYPFGISTKGDGEYFLDDAADTHAFYLQGMGTMEYHYSTGRVLRNAVNAATTIEEVDAVEDTR